MKSNIYLTIFIILIIVGILLFKYFKAKKIKLKLKQKITNNWGKFLNRKYDSDTMDSIAEFFKYRIETNVPKFFIDDITWTDLDMDNIFKRLNYTKTKIGEEVLYSILREIETDISKIKKRDKIINNFENEKDLRCEVEYHLSLLGKDYKYSLASFFFNKYSFETSIKLMIFQVIVPFALLAVFIITNQFLILYLIIACLIWNAKVYTKSKLESESEEGLFEYLISSVGTLEKISKLNIELIDSDYSIKIKSILKRVKPKMKNMFTIILKIQDPLGLDEILNFFFLKRAIVFRLACKEAILIKEELKDVYFIIGEIDTLISVASYRKNLTAYCKPEFLDSKSDNDIEVLNIYHPLINEPITNSIKESKSILLTGSNASGKSTFLKSIAINAILAQTISTVLASKYKCKIVNVLSSMALKDSIINNESYYIVEIKSLKRIIDELNKDRIFTLIFIDEVLRGTNTIERISASTEILSSISNKNCICFAATHDIELSNLVKENYNNYHFQEKIENNQIIFDYKLYDGESKSRNAIKLLEMLGYDEKIINNAEKRAKNYLEAGIWM